MLEEDKLYIEFGSEIYLRLGTKKDLVDIINCNSEEETFSEEEFDRLNYDLVDEMRDALSNFIQDQLPSGRVMWFSI